jgi:hypothetical protein
MNDKMYQILGIKRALTFFGLLCAAVIVLWARIIPPTDPSSLKEWWRIGSGAVSASGLFIALAGQSPIFPFLCRLPFVQNWFPPIDGNWKVAIESNWPAIQQRTHPGSSAVPLASVPATVKIIARLFYIRMNLDTDNRYSTSKTVFVRATRDAEDGSVTLHYLYRSSVRLPEATDSDSHDGAANLTVEQHGSDLWLEGVYWTNRNWHRGLNTAGKITLRRA